MQYYDNKMVGDRVRQIRKKRRMTQLSLSEQLSYVNERQLQRIENGETGCSVDKIIEIAQVLNISTDYLLLGEDYNQKADQDISEILKGKPLEFREYVYQVIKAIVDNMP